MYPDINIPNFIYKPLPFFYLVSGILMIGTGSIPLTIVGACVALHGATVACARIK